VICYMIERTKRLICAYIYKSGKAAMSKLMPCPHASFLVAGSDAAEEPVSINHQDTR
jgi:hypothetical protein